MLPFLFEGLVREKTYEKIDKEWSEVPEQVKLRDKSSSGRSKW